MCPSTGPQNGPGTLSSDHSVTSMAPPGWGTWLQACGPGRRKQAFGGSDTQHKASPTKTSCHSRKMSPPAPAPAPAPAQRLRVADGLRPRGFHQPVPSVLLGKSLYNSISRGDNWIRAYSSPPPSHHANVRGPEAWRPACFQGLLGASRREPWALLHL